MTRWKITIEYNGQNYAGFQRQPELPTIQGEIESAIKQFSQQEVRITVAGRTDAGVHAKGQAAHFDLNYQHADGSPRSMNGFELAKAINAQMIDQPIAVIHAEEVDDEFHARFDVQAKTYH
ncbi:MAG: tRNA pseudouridine synthase A, partial [Pseudomonadota bacterium]